MNIVHDHAPQQFISNVDLFIDQIKKVDHIDLFLSQLRDEDVSRTMYKETLPGAPALQGGQVGNDQGSKINRICDAFLTALKHRTATHFQNVVTANVCKSPPNLDAGLTQIAALREKSPELIDAAIEHICFLADVNRLFDNALGLYDLKLASLVAQQSQKDPKEYVPFLQNLQSMSVLRRQHAIDNHLGRYQKALRHLCDLDAFDEVKPYTMKHALYKETLDFYRYQEDKLNEIMRLYADYLQANGNSKDAGIAYEYLNDYTQASESFRQAHLWKESLSCANLIPMQKPQLHSLAHSLAEALIESKDTFSAATIHLEYLSDIPTAARLYCKGYFFADAFRIIGLHQRPDLLESVIDAGLVEGMASMTELLADCKSQINAQVPRIRELRAKKAEDPLGFYDGEGIEGVDIPDNVSIAPTDASTAGGGSLFTRYTNRTGTVGTNATRRTSKNRRREERKRARGKKGSVYEEEYLVNSVGRLIERINTVNEEVERLIVGLMRRGMRERARAVENAMVEDVELCRACIGEVFEESTKKEGASQKEDGDEERPKGGEGVLWDSLESEKPRNAPVVRDFIRLSLLGP
ncbi:elongator complex protein 1, partial [Lecanoromycetidae sp. Uapishka_2]